jgi:predicted glycogen debranching enzyme
MSIYLGQEVCSNLEDLQTREWLVTNGIGGYASGTIANSLTRGYHGILVAALKPPLERTLLATKIEETAQYCGFNYSLFSNNWAEGKIDPKNHYLHEFNLERTIPYWCYQLQDARLQKRIWMQLGFNTTYIHYQLSQASQPLTLSLKALVNYRDYHGRTTAGNWWMNVAIIENGVRVIAFPNGIPFYIFADRASISLTHDWYYRFDLPRERDRGLYYFDDHLHVANLSATLQPGESLTIVATTEVNPNLDGMGQLECRRAYEEDLLKRATAYKNAPVWIEQLVLAADNFIVDRPSRDRPSGKTILAGYHWFTDWGRDTMISLPGLTLATGRPEIARSILSTFANFISQGMLPNRFPDDGAPLTDDDYNTVDATLWYFEAIRAYYEATQDETLLEELFPKLAEIIEWHCRGTRYNIHCDRSDGLLYAGEPGVQLTWMDAKVANWVVTPRIGKPVEINALWYNALGAIAQFAKQLGKPYREYNELSQKTQQGFQRFWSDDLGYCFDVLDTSEGNDTSLRPNQIFAISLAEDLLHPFQKQKILKICEKLLLTPYGLRSLSPIDFNYKGYYDGDRLRRDGAYHQGTVWTWLLGAFVLAHWQVYRDRDKARKFFELLKNHIYEAGVGNISEIFDGNSPFAPKGCIAQAWSVAEILRVWAIIETDS